MAARAEICPPPARAAAPGSCVPPGNSPSARDNGRRNPLLPIGCWQSSRNPSRRAPRTAGRANRRPRTGEDKRTAGRGPRLVEPSSGKSPRPPAPDPPRYEWKSLLRASPRPRRCPAADAAVRRAAARAARGPVCAEPDNFAPSAPLRRNAPSSTPTVRFDELSGSPSHATAETSPVSLSRPLDSPPPETRTAQRRKCDPGNQPGLQKKFTPMHLGTITLCSPTQGTTHRQACLDKVSCFMKVIAPVHG